jgi:ankyrin repeat protein
MGFKLGKLGIEHTRYRNFYQESTSASEPNFRKSSSPAAAPPQFNVIRISEIIRSDRSADLASLLSQGLPVTFDMGNDSLLSFALEYSAYKSAKLLVEKGADVNYSCPGTQVSVLSRCVSRKDIPAIQFLLEHKVDVNKKIPVLSNPLFLAVENEATEIVKILVNAGADVNIQVSGKTLVERAAMAWYNQGKDMSEIVKCLNEVIAKSA